MSRIRQYADAYDMSDLRDEVNAQRARVGLNSFESFGNAIGVSAKSAWSYIKDPGMIRLKELRSIVKTIKPDPEVLLKALGYSGKEIKTMAKIIASR